MRFGKKDVTIGIQSKSTTASSLPFGCEATHRLCELRLENNDAASP